MAVKTKIIVLVKDEKQYLEEWIKYHLDLGFSDIDIYEDYGSVSHSDIVSKFANVNLINLDNSAEFHCDDYGTAYRYGRILEHALLNDSYEYDWLACIDVDEFIMFDKKCSLQSFLEEFKTYPGVYLYWKYMSASGNVKKCKNVLQSYVEESSFINSGKYEFKCLFNVKNTMMLHGHSHHCAKCGVTTAKQPILTYSIKEFDRKRTYNRAWINHYFTKSWEDWCERIYEKGNLTYNVRKLLDFFDYNQDMLSLKDELVKPLIGKRPRSTIWLDHDESLLYVGKTVSIDESCMLNKMITSAGLAQTQDYIQQHYC